MSRFVVRAGLCAMFVASVAGCSMPGKKTQTGSSSGASAAAAAAGATPQPAACSPVGESPLVGMWHSVTKQSGVRGEMRRLILLKPDGNYRLETRLQDGRNIRAELRETGCWETTGSTYTTRVTHSSGEPVDPSDPIYRNSYRVERVNATQLVSRENVPGAKSVTARKMPADYRMP